MNEANTMFDITGQEQPVAEAPVRLGNGPRVTLEAINANIASEHFFVAAEAIHGEDMILGRPSQTLPEALRLLTICVLVLRNGFTVVGTSAPAAPENCDAGTGRKYARENAVKQLWPLMGYALRERLRQHEIVASLPFAPQKQVGDIVDQSNADRATGEGMPERHENGDGR